MKVTFLIFQSMGWWGLAYQIKLLSRIHSQILPLLSLLVGNARKELINAGLSHFKSFSNVHDRRFHRLSFESYESLLSRSQGHDLHKRQ